MLHLITRTFLRKQGAKFYKSLEQGLGCDENANDSEGQECLTLSFQGKWELNAES